jgi:hypothetical protein
VTARAQLRLVSGGVTAEQRRGLAAAALAAEQRCGFEAAALAAEQRRGFAAAALAAEQRRGFAAAALAAAGSWLLEPVEPLGERSASAPPRPRPVVAVFGLARGCGATVVSRSLAAELARRDGGGAAAVHCDARAAGIPLATQAATQLARALADVPGADTRAVGRLCLVGGADRGALAHSARHVAPLVLDTGSSSLGGVPAALADRVILVATPAIEPALAAVAADCLSRLDHEPIVVLNRTPPEHALNRSLPDWSLRTAHRLPESRMGAQLALGGREPRGELGRAIAELADLCEVAR